MVVHHPPWAQDVVLGIADVLGAPGTGLTPPEVGRLLAAQSLPDPGHSITQRHRLAHALLVRQTADNASNCIIRFIRDAMAPARYVNAPGLRARRRDALNDILAGQGLRVLDDGRLCKGAQAAAPKDAAQRADHLRSELRRRGTHPAVLRHCSDEVLTKGPPHAMQEVAASVFAELRARTGLTGNEQIGLGDLIAGLSRMFDPRGTSTVTDDELLDFCTMLSLIHRRLDAAG